MRVYRSLYRIIIITSLFFSHVVRADLKAEGVGEDTIIVKDLSADFLFYDHNGEGYAPYLNQKLDNTNKSLSIPVGAYKDYHLIFKATPGLSVFQNYRLVYENTGSQSENVFLALGELFSGSSLDMFTFYHEDGALPSSVRIGYMGRLPDESGQQMLIRNREAASTPGMSFFILMSILMIGIVIKQICTKEALWILAPEAKVQGGLEDTAISVNFFQWPYILIIAFNALCFTYLISLLEYAPIKIRDVGDYALCALVVFLLYYLKYIFLGTMARVFNIGGVAKIHFREVIRISFWFHLIVAPILSIAYFSTLIEWRISYIGFLAVLMLALSLGLLRLFVLTFRVPQFNYLYLFSYLCMAEIIPLAFVIKITLLSGLSL